MPLLEGFEWVEADWALDTEHAACDRYGWTYGFDWWHLTMLAEQGCTLSRVSAHHCVRRRLWRRTQRRLPSTVLRPIPPPEGALGASWANGGAGGAGGEGPRLPTLPKLGSGHSRAAIDVLNASPLVAAVAPDRVYAEVFQYERFHPVSSWGARARARACLLALSTSARGRG